MSASDRFIGGYSLTDAADEWDDILGGFRALGGVAENICLGPNSRGLFPIDPGQPFRLHVPERLIFPLEQIGFSGDRMAIQESDPIPSAEREFFARYANALSWGPRARQESPALMAAFDGLPNDIWALLATEFGMADWLEGERVTRAQKQFLRSRAFEFHGKDVFVPILELAKHDSGGLQWNLANGVEVAGQANGEILVSSGLHDPFSMFHHFAVARRERIAFSLPMKVQIGATALSIERSFEVVRQGNVMVPQMKNTGDGLTVSFLMLGHPNFPRLPRGTFRALMRPLGVENADEEFDRILHANWSRFLGLLAALERYSSELITSLRTMAQYQLEAMSFCIGARDL